MTFRARAALAALTLMTVVAASAWPVHAQAQAADDFDRRSLGAGWQVHLGRVGIVASSDLGLTAASPIGIASWVGSSVPGDQFSEVEVSADVAPNMLVQTYVRRRDADAARYGFHYDSDPNDSTGGPGAWAIKYDGVPGDETRILASNTARLPVRPGDRLRLEVRGSSPVSLRGYVNGVLVLSASDNAPEAITAGLPGAAFRLQVGTSTDYPTPVIASWSGGAITAPPPTTTEPPRTTTTQPPRTTTTTSRLGPVILPPLPSATPSTTSSSSTTTSSAPGSTSTTAPTTSTTQPHGSTTSSADGTETATVELADASRPEGSDGGGVSDELVVVAVAFVLLVGAVILAPRIVSRRSPDS